MYNRKVTEIYVGSPPASVLTWRFRLSSLTAPSPCLCFLWHVKGILWRLLKTDKALLPFDALTGYYTPIKQWLQQPRGPPNGRIDGAQNKILNILCDTETSRAVVFAVTSQAGSSAAEMSESVLCTWWAAYIPAASLPVGLCVTEEPPGHVTAAWHADWAGGATVMPSFSI